MALLRKTLSLGLYRGIPHLKYETERILDETLIRILKNQTLGIASNLPPGTGIILDWSRVRYNSSANLGANITLHKIVKGLEGELVMVELCPAVQEVFHITGLHNVITLRDTLEQAAEFLKNRTKLEYIPETLCYGMACETVASQHLPNLLKELSEIADSPDTPPTIIIDVGQVKRMHSQIFNALCSAENIFTEQGKRLFLSNYRPDSGVQDNTLSLHQGCTDLFERLASHPAPSNSTGELQHAAINRLAE